MILLMEGTSYKLAPAGDVVTKIDMVFSTEKLRSNIGRELENIAKAKYPDAKINKTVNLDKLERAHSKSGGVKTSDGDKNSVGMIFEKVTK